MQILTPSTGATPHQTNTFDVSIIVPVAGLSFTLGALQVFESALSVQGIQALISVLARGRRLLLLILLTAFRI
jgi:hypothetical protein